MDVAAEAEDGRRVLARVRRVDERRDPDSAADEEGSLDVEPEAVPERAEDVDRLAGIERAQRPGSGADRVDQEGELCGGREAEAHRAREQPAGRLEHEELAGPAWLEPAAPKPQERVRAHRLDSDCCEAFTPQHDLRSLDRCESPAEPGFARR